MVLRLKPLSGCQERDCFGSVVRAILNLNFEDINGQLISIRLKKGLLYFFITTYPNRLKSGKSLQKYINVPKSVTVEMVSGNIYVGKLSNNFGWPN